MLFTILKITAMLRIIFLLLMFTIHSQTTLQMQIFFQNVCRWIIIHQHRVTLTTQKAVYVPPHTARWERMNGVLSITGMMHEAES